VGISIRLTDIKPREYCALREIEMQHCHVVAGTDHFTRTARYKSHGITDLKEIQDVSAKT
jgi:hypothetical protein